MKNIYITAAEPYTGKSIVALGMMQALLQRGGKVAFFRPILQARPTQYGGQAGGQAAAKLGAKPGTSPAEFGLIDTDITLILSYFDLHMNYEDAYGITGARAKVLLNAGKHDQLIEEILFKYKQLENRYDFILCEGTDFLHRDAAFEFDLNTEIATNLGGAVLTVISGQDRTAEEIITFSQLIANQLNEKDLDNYALVINRCNLHANERKALPHKIKLGMPHSSPPHQESAIFVLPENDALAKPTLGDVLEHLDALMIYGHGRTESQVENFYIAAGGTESFLKSLKANSLVITSSDRPDLVLSALATRMSTCCPDISALLVCGEKKLPTQIIKLLKGWSATPLPILTSSNNVLETTKKLASLHSKLSPKDTRKIAAALGLFEHHVKTSRLTKNIVKNPNQKISPKMMELKLIDLARRKKTHIVLPEGSEERTLQAVEILLARNAVQITLLGDEQEIKAQARQLNVSIEGAKIINPALSPDLDNFTNTYFEMRKHKGITQEQARENMLDPIYFGTMMLYKRQAQGIVSGAVHTTADTIRPAFEIIKTQPQVNIASSVFLMCMHNQIYIFGDCAVVVDPTAEELADIALSSVATAKIFGIEPRVAMLSYSTGTSGKGADVDKVKKATELVRQASPKLLLEGPIQYDAAVDPQTARLKLPGSKVAGRASIFIFPDLNTGNNTYKAVQRAAGAVAIGPILQGLNMPVNDLSRGASVADIVNTIAITAIQAQSIK